jgi:hypothetical protein
MVDERRRPGDLERRSSQPAFQPKKLGLSPQSPLQILMGEGTPSLQATMQEHGLIGVLQQFALRGIGANVEFGAEGVSGGLQLLQAAGTPGGGVSSLEPDKTKRTDGTAINIVELLAGQDPVTASSPTVGGGAPDQQAAEIAKLSRGLDTPAAVFTLSQTAGNYELPTEIQAQIDQLTEMATIQVDDINNQINQKMSQLQVGQQLYGGLVGEAERVGIIPPLDSEQGKVLATTLDSLESTLQAEDLQGGLTPDVLAAITSVGDAQFASTDPDQAFNLLSHKIDFEQNLISEIETLVKQRQLVQDNTASVEEALRLEGQSDTFNLPLDVPTSEGMFLTVYGDFISEQLSDTNLDTFQEKAIALQLTEIGEQAVIAGGAEQFAPQLQLIADTYGLDFTKLTNAVNNGLEQGLEAAGLADAWRENPVLEPGSPSLAAGIQETILQLGGTPEDAARLVNSTSLHQLIALASGGQVGAETDPNMLGLGGLAPDTYETFGYDYETIKADAASQLAALIQYIYTRFGGDTVQALEAFREGSWGGVN